MKNKHMKTFLSILLAVSMVAGVTACGSSDVNTSEDKQSSEVASSESSAPESSSEPVVEEYVNMDDFFPIVKEPITITVAGQNANTVNWNDTDMVNYIRENMGIDMYCTQYEKDAWPTQFTLMLSTDELPDVVIRSGQTQAAIQGYAEEGYFLALDEYLDYMPNFKALLDEYPDYKASVTAPDGHIYGLNALSTNHMALIDRSWINQEWLDNVGMKNPTTLDEFYEVLKAFKEQDANGNGDPDDELPICTSTSSRWKLRTLMPSFGLYTQEMFCQALADENGNVFFAQTTDNYREFLKFVNKLYEEGLYDNASLMQNGDEYYAKVRSGRVGTLLGESAAYVALEGDAELDTNWPWLQGLASEHNGNQRIAVLGTAVNVSNVRCLVNANTEYPEAICRLIDYFITHEGRRLAASGVEGVSYEIKMDEALGAEVISTLNPDSANYESAEAYRYKKAIINEGFNFIGQEEYNPNIIKLGFDKEQLAKDGMLSHDDHVAIAIGDLKTVSNYPNLNYTSDENSEITKYKADIKMYIEAAWSQFVNGELDIESDADWNAYVSTIEGMGLDKWMEIEQAAYDRQFK